MRQGTQQGAKRTTNVRYQPQITSCCLNAYRMARNACRRTAATRALVAAAAAACASWLQLAASWPPTSMPKLPPSDPMQMPLLTAA